MKQILLFLSLLTFASLCLSSFDSSTMSPARAVAQQYQQDLQQLSTTVQRLHQAAQQLETGSLSSLQKTFRQSRLQYKKVAYLAEYLDGEFVRDFINGAPLPKLERNAPNLNVIQPKGFQALEEMIYDDDPLTHQSDIVKLTGLLDKKVAQLVRLQGNVQLTDRQVLEATRFELIRLFTLGVTGFDSPAALLSIPEAQMVLTTLREAVSAYLPLLSDRSLAKQTAATLDQAIAFVEQSPDFDKFNRLTFLRDYVNPLFRQVLEVQLDLGIETYYETTPQHRKHSVNYLATDLFDEDLLNPFYYTRMPAQKYEPEVIELGRTLFYDPVLSTNNQRSCASCHQPEKAFTDGAKKSLALNPGETVDRNAPTLLNAAYADRYFYDLRSAVLEDQMDHVVADHREFFTSYLDIADKLGQSSEYHQQFSLAFPELNASPINKYSLTTALAAYVVSLRSFNSPFDRYVRRESDDLPVAAQRGFNLFMGKAACGTCHFAPLFNGSVPPLYHESETEVLGVPATADTLSPTLDADPGRAEGILKERVNFYYRSFKTTTVRNVALTAPYMHNGVYDSLSQVVDFYNRGGGLGLGLDVPHQTLSGDPLELTAQEQADLVSFMESLTDTTTHHAPTALPAFARHPDLNQRPVGGTY